ncbi:transporter [Candidatus Peregrinibacteria bacterium RIFOXYA12_FULL_33_12]|nr:MAG: transporter [Candidatus Peregrinibacteria bacterium RIFOXYA12_FULL_33_12]
MKNFKYLDLITAFFAAILLISNITSSKITTIGPFTFDAGTILFPLSYIFGDVLTEVYGYARSRRVIWTGFAIILFASLIIFLVQKLPPALDWDGQAAYEKILGITPRIVFASLIAFFAGEFSNSYILAKLKIHTKGKFLWLRTIFSTLIGEGLDTLIFIFIAFYGIFEKDLIITLIISNYIFKVGVEILFTPITYAITNFLKKVENEDFYDYKTKFNPFLVRE